MYRPTPTTVSHSLVACEILRMCWVDPCSAPLPPFQTSRPPTAETLAEIDPLIAFCEAGSIYAVERWIQDPGSRKASHCNAQRNPDPIPIKPPPSADANHRVVDCELLALTGSTCTRRLNGHLFSPSRGYSRNLLLALVYEAALLFHNYSYCLSNSRAMLPYAPDGATWSKLDYERSRLHSA